MKIQIRRSVFESNSSSTHAITVSSDTAKYQDFVHGRVFYDTHSWSSTDFYTKEELEEIYKKENTYYPSFDYWRVNEGRYQTAPELGSTGYSQDDVEEFCVEDDLFGIVIFGYAGRD